MNKIIIDNRTNSTDEKALEFALEIVRMGKISTGRFGEQYCYASTRAGQTLFVSKRKSGTHQFLISTP